MVKNVLKILEEYELKQRLYKDFSVVVKSILEQMLSESEIKFQHITCREKDLEKLREKIERKTREGKFYENLDEVEDLAGTRIVFYLESDKKKFLDILYEEFREIIKDGEEKYKIGGYTATHLILRLDDSRIKLREYRKYKGLKCELQITSSLFHAWSEVEHDITYKTPEESIVLMEELGLKEIKASFGNVMEKHIRTATLQLDDLNDKYHKMSVASTVLKDDFITKIQNTKSNDEIYRNLEVIEDYFHKKLDTILSIIKVVLSKKPMKAQVIHKFTDKDLYGKTHDDLMAKCLDIIDSQRVWYKDFNQSLGILKNLTHHHDKGIKAKSFDTIKKIAKYDLDIIQNRDVGYAFQRMILDYILGFNKKDKKDNLDLIQIVTEEILSSDIKGVSHTTLDTFTFRSASIVPTDFLKKMRRDSMDMLENLIVNEKNISIKIKLVKILAKVSQLPSHAIPNENLTMFQDDNKYLSKIYRKIIFDSAGKLGNLALASTIEEQLGWINRLEQTKTEETQALQKEILNDYKFSIFSTFVGREPYQDLQIKARNEMETSFYKKLTRKTLKSNSELLNEISDQIQYIEEWEFQQFKRFLIKVSKEKPELAYEILMTNYARKNGVIKFLTSILIGLRESPRLDLWDLVLKRIVKEKDFEGVVSILASLNLGIDEEFRSKDFKIIEEITKNSKRFKFLKGKQTSSSQYTLLNILARNFKRSASFFENLIVEEIIKNPQNMNMYIRELATAVFSKWISYENWSEKNMEFLIKNIIHTNDLDYPVQQLMLQINEKIPNAIFKIFGGRIKKKIVKKYDGTKEYEPIPYHINPELKEYISNSPMLIDFLQSLIEKMTPEWTLYNVYVRYFLQRTSGITKEILKALIQRNGGHNLLEIAKLINNSEPADLEICIEVVKKTEDQNIINQMDSALSATGVMTGPYGIADFYKSRAEELTPYITSENKNVAKFAGRMMNSFLKNEVAERKRVDEERGRRQLEFEGF